MMVSNETFWKMRYCIGQCALKIEKNEFSFHKDQVEVSLVVRKPVVGVSDQVSHKPGCTVTENG